MDVMFEKLKKHFPSLIYYEKPPTQIDPTLRWFIAKNGHVIGIHPSEIIEKDLTLLHMFLEPYENIFPPLSTTEKQWKQFIHDEGEAPHLDELYRFIFFQISEDQLQLFAFKEAINELYGKNVVILWENKTEGVIVDFKKRNQDDHLFLEEIIDVLMSDLYAKVRFFVGPFLSTLTLAKQYYKRLAEEANSAFSYFENNVITYFEAIPYMLINKTTDELKDELQHLILQEFQEDAEFIQMVEVLLKCNLNVSETAKKLYMHRNSLQYRMEKFYNKTGLDIRKFHHAMTVYLALLTKK